MQIFSNVGHGFAVRLVHNQNPKRVYILTTVLKSRARLTDPYEKWAKEQHFKSFVDWFDFWLAKK